MSRRKPLAALAAVSAAVAVLVPTATASAAPVDPVLYGSTTTLCSMLSGMATGDPVLAGLIGQTLAQLGCEGATG